METEGLLPEEDTERGAVEGRLCCPDLAQTGPTGGRDSDLKLRQDGGAHSSTVAYRRYGSQLAGVKVRHKRQVLQDMARPLKHWLYKHRNNPYPTKTEKVLLALGSHMTLVQVSNWFANARRRLKNTVRQPDLSWALRIKLYNKYIQGNAERLSVCSDDVDSDEEECPLQTSVRHPSNFGRSTSNKSALQKNQRVLAMTDSANSDDGASPPSKYKSSLLHRYLNDTVRHMMAANAKRISASCKRSDSESFSSNECDQDAVSPASSFDIEANYVYHMDTMDGTPTNCDAEQQRPGHQGWREIHAAVALTSLAHGRGQAAEDKAGVTLSRYPPVPYSTARATVIGRTCATTGSASAPWPGSAIEPSLTSRIIQKSSHISEVQTVKATAANGD